MIFSKKKEMNRRNEYEKMNRVISRSF